MIPDLVEELRIAVELGESLVSLARQPDVIGDDIRVLELDRAKAPGTVANFLQYVEDGFYDGGDGLGATIFHRVISGFVIQAGGFTQTDSKPARAPIASENRNGLTNDRGTIAMALKGTDENSADSQFFINLVDNDDLNIGVGGPPGFTVFGRVVQGLGVVDAIAAVQTADGVQLAPGVTGDDVPVNTITIESASVLPSS